uniref:Pesticidal crystal protein N-terminal domain-containing protein n=1 Tax=Mucochytrium quahogii TaxID=96639 RepID=A0A7S2RT29_9STRA
MALLMACLCAAVMGSAVDKEEENTRELTKMVHNIAARHGIAANETYKLSEVQGFAGGLRVSSTNGAVVTGDPNQMYYDIIQKFYKYAFGKIPYVGGLLTSLVDAFWPKHQPSIFELIEEQVSQLVDQKILEYELRERTTELELMRDAMTSFTLTKGVERRILFSRTEDHALSLIKKITASPNRAQFVSLFEATITTHMTLMREKVLFGKEIYDEDFNQKKADKEISDAVIAYRDILADVLKEYKDWIHEEYRKKDKGFGDKQLRPGIRYAKTAISLKTMARIGNYVPGHENDKPVYIDGSGRLIIGPISVCNGFSYHNVKCRVADLEKSAAKGANGPLVNVRYGSYGFSGDFYNLVEIAPAGYDGSSSHQSELWYEAKEAVNVEGIAGFRFNYCGQGISTVRPIYYRDDKVVEGDKIGSDKYSNRDSDKCGNIRTPTDPEYEIYTFSETYYGYFVTLQAKHYKGAPSISVLDWVGGKGGDKQYGVDEAAIDSITGRGLNGPVLVKTVAIQYGANEMEGISYEIISTDTQKRVHVGAGRFGRHDCVLQTYGRVLQIKIFYCDHYFVTGIAILNEDVRPGGTWTTCVKGKVKHTKVYKLRRDEQFIGFSGKSGILVDSTAPQILRSGETF